LLGQEACLPLELLLEPLNLVLSLLRFLLTLLDCLLVALEGLLVGLPLLPNLVHEHVTDLDRLRLGA
jgi:hypothetical protein